MQKLIISAAMFSVATCLSSYAQDQFPNITVVRPVEIGDVLNNPGIGFNTFQRFNGDALNTGIGWTEGFPNEYQDFDGDLTDEYAGCKSACMVHKFPLREVSIFASNGNTSFIIFRLFLPFANYGLTRSRTGNQRAVTNDQLAVYQDKLDTGSGRVLKQYR